jgi:hypothetical protein
MDILCCGRQRTLPVVSEQPESASVPEPADRRQMSELGMLESARLGPGADYSGIVVFRCDRCARQHGRAPVLAMAHRDPAEGWALFLARRTSQSAHVGSVQPWGGPTKRNARLSYMTPDAKPGESRLLLILFTASTAAQLACRRRGCSAKPRVARATLVEMAEQTIAAGRHDAYV